MSTMATMTRADIEKVKPGAPCKVRRKVAGRSGYVYVDGHVKEPSGRGCFIVTSDGNSNFYRWTEVEFPLVEPKVERKPTAPKSLATLGDVLKPALAVVKPAPAPEPEPEPVPEPAPKPARKPRGPDRAPRRARRHEPTLVGNMVRNARLKRGLSQAQAGVELGIKAGRLCVIELGDDMPSDDELVLFAAGLDLPLDSLKLACVSAATLYDEPAPEPESAPAMFVPPPPPVEPVFQPTIPSPPPPAQGIDDFQAFIDELDALVAMPRDREKRAEWFTAARALFKLR